MASNATAIQTEPPNKLPAGNTDEAQEAMSVMNTKINIYNLVGNIDEIVRKVTADIHLAANPAEACPAQRKKVEDLTPKPPAKIMGKVAEVMKK